MGRAQPRGATLTRHVVEEVDGEFVIPVVGFVCSELRGDHDLILRDPSSPDEAWLWASCLDADTIRRLVEAKAAVTQAVASADGTLRVAFDNGASLVNPPHAEVEAWEVRGPGYVLVVGTPGGGRPAVWDETSEIRRIEPGADELPTQVTQMLEIWPTLPDLTGACQFRPTARGRDAIELHQPDAPPVNRRELVRFVLQDTESASRGPYLRYTN